MTPGPTGDKAVGVGDDGLGSVGLSGGGVIGCGG